MPSHRGPRAADRLGLATALSALALAVAFIGLARDASAEGAPPIAFDAMFYRARAAFNYCYLFQGTVGFSLRPVDEKITHEAGTPCLADATADPRAWTTTMCGGACQADCTSFVRKSWHASRTSEALMSRDFPGPCSGPDGSSGETRIVDKGQDADKVYSAIDGLRPGDDCENEVHTVLLLNREDGHSWKTWEANSSAGGVGQFDRALDSFLEITSTPDVCGYGEAGNGCWRPNAERTGAPALLLPATGAALDDLAKITFRFQRPSNLPALADYLVWIRWDDNEGTDQPPAIQHRLVRVPAFTARDQSLAVRLASFPNQSSMASYPTDVGEVDVLEVSGSLLAAAPVYTPSRFKRADEGGVTTAWVNGLVPCVPTTPVARPAESSCTFTADTLAVKSGITYTWQVRVDRFGEDIGGFRRGTSIGACKLDGNGQESDPVCKDPEWSAPSTFGTAASPKPDCGKACTISFTCDDRGVMLLSCTSNCPCCQCPPINTQQPLCCVDVAGSTCTSQAGVTYTQDHPKGCCCGL